MRVLTESMTRLRDEILALRHDRQTFRTELERSTKAAQVRVSALRRTIANDLAGARCAWQGTISRRPAHPAPPAPSANLSFKKHKKR